MAEGADDDFLIGHQAHGLAEPISAAGNRDDVLFFKILTKGFTEHEDVTGEIGFFDKGVGPDRLHEVVFGDDLLAIAKQGEEHS